MKLRILTFILSLLLLLTSCATTPKNGDVLSDQGENTTAQPIVDPADKYKVYLLERDLFYGLEKSDITFYDPDYNPEHYVREDAQKQLTFEFDGEQYTLNYKYSYSVPTVDFTEVDVYENDYTNISDLIEIGVNQKSGKIISFLSWEYDKDEYYQQMIDNNATVYDKEALLEKTKDFVSHQIDCFSEYTLEYFDTASGPVYCSIFTRFVQGIPTNDTIMVFISDFGEIMIFDMQNMGCIDESKFPTETDMQYIVNEVDKKITKIFENYMQIYEYEIVEVRFERINTNEHVLYFEVETRELSFDSDISQWEDYEFCYFGRFVVYI